jgi:hypothetical protein
MDPDETKNLLGALLRTTMKGREWPRGLVAVNVAVPEEKIVFAVSADHDERAVNALVGLLPDRVGVVRPTDAPVGGHTISKR